MKSWAEQLREKERAIGVRMGIEEGIEKGIEQGIEEGIERGIERGRLGERRDLLLRLIPQRFGPLPPQAEQAIHQADGDALQRMLDRLLQAESLDELLDA